RPDLEDPAVWTRLRLGEDRVEDVGIGEEVLTQPMLGPETGGAQRPPNGRGIDPGGARRARGHGRRLSDERAAAMAARRGTGRPARLPRTGGPRPPRSSPRCRCTGPDAARSA